MQIFEKTVPVNKLYCFGTLEEAKEFCKENHISMNVVYDMGEYNMYRSTLYRYFIHLYNVIKCGDKVVLDNIDLFKSGSDTNAYKSQKYQLEHNNIFTVRKVSKDQLHSYIELVLYDTDIVLTITDSDYECFSVIKENTTDNKELVLYYNIDEISAFSDPQLNKLVGLYGTVVNSVRVRVYNKEYFIDTIYYGYYKVDYDFIKNNLKKLDTHVTRVRYKKEIDHLINLTTHSMSCGYRNKLVLDFNVLNLLESYKKSLQLEPIWI